MRKVLKSIKTSTNINIPKGAVAQAAIKAKQTK